MLEGDLDLRGFLGLDASVPKGYTAIRASFRVKAAPEDLLREIENKVWEWTVHSDDLPALKQKHIISGTIRRSDGVQVRVVSANQPDANAQTVSPNLEDAYLFFIGGKQ